MNKTWVGCLTGLLLLFLFSLSARWEEPLVLSSETAEKMGRQIWQHECKGTEAGLTSWNCGEEFASLGIGHFIWYPTGTTGSFKQTFPELLIFLQSKGVELPVWLAQADGCPWASKEAFDQAQQEPRMVQLRHILASNISLQALFMVQRLQKALPTLLSALTKETQRQQVTQQFYRLAKTPEGIFALLDYLNFKGEGVLRQERYQGEGWGLLQILQKMQGSTTGRPALEEFSAAAKEVLTRRVEHAPPERNEGRWLKGWHNRLDSYLTLSF